MSQLKFPIFDQFLLFENYPIPPSDCPPDGYFHLLELAMLNHLKFELHSGLITQASH